MTMQMTETTAPFSHPLRSGGAVVAGFVAVVILSTVGDLPFHALGVYPAEGQSMDPRLLGVALAYRTVFTVAGGYLTAWLAPSRPVAHTVVLGVVGIVAGTVGAITMWKLGDQWYPIALVILALPSTWFGGWLLSRRNA